MSHFLKIINVMFIGLIFLATIIFDYNNRIYAEVKSDDKLAKCKNIALETIKHYGTKNVIPNICNHVLNKQINFSGIIAEEGALITFNEKGDVLYGISTRIIDYGTKKVFPAREYTESELMESRDRLRTYKKLLEKEGSTFEGIVIFSNSLKNACCEVLMNNNKDTTYYGGREGTLLIIYRKRGDKSEKIAAEQIYPK